MSTGNQMIHVHYRSNSLLLLDSDDITPLYTVQIGRETPQMQLVSLFEQQGEAPNDNNGNTRRLSTALFKMLSTDVKLSIRGKPALMQRSNLFSRSYCFRSVALDGESLFWEADGALSGDFKLVHRQNGRVLTRFRNKVFSAVEVGSFEMVGELSESLKEEILITGLSVLVMVQSLNLAGMVLMGSG
ncbi:hypothetical protein N7481_013271 [Penicillium waksmanii]|uniref:uncharacterized protein n=1 Tax=Penicillium waksmanii TaxID=69791 RepID=UPI0025477008|nr:uncharacterized protein N7481_013271 [Penicillium waksmanii]KAJ5966557.1 hypothetical protein N7481_013271 [Penicillium waksmanii]